LPEFAQPFVPVEDQYAPISSPVQGIATHYGSSYGGQTMGCGGVYSSYDPRIIAVGTAREGTWSCGTLLNVCGSSGCVVGIRQDSCPGCERNHLDLSEAGIADVCGSGAEVCDITIQAMIETQPTPSPFLQPLTQIGQMPNGQLVPQLGLRSNVVSTRFSP
jgi:hypothetical protein